MKTRFILFFVWLCTSSIVTSGVFAGHPYEVVLVKGKVNYKDRELKRGDKLILTDMDIRENMNREYSHFSFGTNSDEVHFLDVERRKIILISARINKQGRDLMLATRGIKFVRSDFEFQRAFSPENGVLTLLAEDTLICTGLDVYRFTQNTKLAVGYQWNGLEIFQEIGHNDTLFLTRHSLFSIDTPEGPVQLNSFEIEKINLYLLNDTSSHAKTILPDIQPFSLYFLNDIIQYYAQVKHDGIGMDANTVFQMIMPDLIGSRQIQREFGMLNEQEAKQWLKMRIEYIFSL
jgi:hypothetical protein